MAMASTKSVRCTEGRGQVMVMRWRGNVFFIRSIPMIFAGATSISCIGVLLSFELVRLPLQMVTAPSSIQRSCTTYANSENISSEREQRQQKITTCDE